LLRKLDAPECQRPRGTDQETGKRKWNAQVDICGKRTGIEVKGWRVKKKVSRTEKEELVSQYMVLGLGKDYCFSFAQLSKH